MGNTKSDKPTVHRDGAGVSHVRAADILTSRSGQAEIQKAANYAVNRQIRQVDKATLVRNRTK